VIERKDICYDAFAELAKTGLDVGEHVWREAPAKVASQKCVVVVLVSELRRALEKFGHGGSLQRWRRPRSCSPRRRHRTSETIMIRKLKTGQYRLYSKKKNPKTGKRRNLGTFKTRAAAQKHERAVEYFKRGG
jgi:hypothetical protein